MHAQICGVPSQSTRSAVKSRKSQRRPLHHHIWHDVLHRKQPRCGGGLPWGRLLSCCSSQRVAKSSCCGWAAVTFAAKFPGRARQNACWSLPCKQYNKPAQNQAQDHRRSISNHVHRRQRCLSVPDKRLGRSSPAPLREVRLLLQNCRYWQNKGKIIGCI